MTLHERAVLPPGRCRQETEGGATVLRRGRRGELPGDRIRSRLRERDLSESSVSDTSTPVWTGSQQEGTECRNATSRSRKHRDSVGSQVLKSAHSAICDPSSEASRTASDGLRSLHRDSSFHGDASKGRSAQNCCESGKRNNQRNIHSDSRSSSSNSENCSRNSCSSNNRKCNTDLSHRKLYCRSNSATT